jgi:hypothetical protein
VNGVVSLLGGIVAIVLGIIGLAVNWPGGQLGITYLWKGLVAVVPALLILGGCVAIGAGIGSVKDKMRTKKEEEKKPEEKAEEKTETEGKKEE